MKQLTFRPDPFLLGMIGAVLLAYFFPLDDTGLKGLSIESLRPIARSRAGVEGDSHLLFF